MPGSDITDEIPMVLLFEKMMWSFLQTNGRRDGKRGRLYFSATIFVLKTNA